jgi:NAD-dependent dihydropyrimidine dehydrogenase PreA subunit
MAYVITDPCIGSKDQSCVEVCPVDCIYEAEQLMVIHPGECIDCGACLPECPVDAIYEKQDVPVNQAAFIGIGALISQGIAAVDGAVAEHQPERAGALRA